MKAKKVILIFLIVALFAVAISTTIFVFFKNRKISGKAVFNSATYVSSVEKSKDMRETKTLITSLKSTDDRFDGVIETIDNISLIVNSLSLYSASLNYEIESGNLVEKSDNANKRLNDLYEVVKEFNIKKDSAYFDKKLGANDLLL